MNKVYDFFKKISPAADAILVIIFFATTLIKEPKDINYLEWIAVILCFILINQNTKMK